MNYDSKKPMGERWGEVVRDTTKEQKQYARELHKEGNSVRNITKVLNRRFGTKLTEGRIRQYLKG